jgi:predicted nucleotidyltransferase
MVTKDISIIYLETIATALGDLLPKVTFVGGSTTVLLVDEVGRYGVRKTEDVDVIIDVVSLVEYQRISERLRNLGFREDVNGPICRWLIDTDIGNLKLDVMPTDERILGFSNRWYRAAIDHSMNVSLSNGVVIQVVSPAYFLATKFEAFAGRGDGDFFSHDLEDIVFVMENRSGLIDELSECPHELQFYLSAQAQLLLCDDFLNVLPGLLNNPKAASKLEHELRDMAGWSKA